MYSLEEWKRRLRKYSPENIKGFDDEHVKMRMEQRGITKEMIEENLLNPDKLIEVSEQESLIKEINKFEFCFELSHKRELSLIVKMDSKDLYLTTCIIKYRKWQKEVDRWKRKRF